MTTLLEQLTVVLENFSLFANHQTINGEAVHVLHCQSRDKMYMTAGVVWSSLFHFFF